MTQNDTEATGNKIVPLSLKDAPALIEKLLPVQKLSVEAYKESMAGASKTLTGLGSYWKGRKALVLNKAVILGTLLPATADLHKDLAIFEMLMAMDTDSLWRRFPRSEALNKATKNFKAEGWDTSSPEARAANARRTLAQTSFRDSVSQVERAESVDQEYLYGPIWGSVNAHLGTNAFSFPELTEQLGIMRFGHRPKVADTFSGSGQIPFEAARLGCDVYASDLNPIATMLTWGALNIVGADTSERAELEESQERLVKVVRDQIDALQIESDGAGWRGKVYLYCVEVTDPATGWRVPVLPSLVVVRQTRIIAQLVPNKGSKSFDIVLVHDAADEEMEVASKGTYVQGDVVYFLDDAEHRVKLSTLRGDHKLPDGSNANRLRMWEKSDFMPRPGDFYQERLYAVLWVKNDTVRKTEFRSVTEDDLKREQIVNDYVGAHLAGWQEAGWVPDMRIEPGDKTDEPIRTRGWAYWHHLFNPRQLLTAALVNQHSDARLKFGLAQVLNFGSRLSRWQSTTGSGKINDAFYNQALNTLYDYGTRGFDYASPFLEMNYKSYPLNQDVRTEIKALPASSITTPFDLALTDPPYGSAVRYEEIYEFFIAWLRKNPPPEFANWTWDSRRALAIKGEDHNFKAEMVAAYKAMTNCMPDNGMQVIMFTHQSGSIWADMSNIVWASGLQVSAAWYVVTETDSALRQGQYIKGTILLVLRKRLGNKATSRDELAYEIEDEVKAQVELLTGLNQDTKDLYRDENLFEDADLQMAGYAAALRVLTKYTTIDGVDMTQEALRPRVKKQKTLVDELIDYAVAKANEYLVPTGLSQDVWDKLTGIERFYLKMVDMESKDVFVLSNYQNFAKAFKVQDFSPLMADTKANNARLKDAVALNKRYMGAGDEFGSTLVRTVLYGIYQLASTSVGGDRVIAEVKSLVANYYQNRELLIAIADYLAKKRATLNPEESYAAGILRDLVRNERM
ncbi:anti-phage-associated DUF1156 domain-containing protein [Acidithrix sp. C25]|uniref:anti-phage-associated DUF1156 domain-containing protein n=1 Tax=Acidithrix sp. C25 TaxID=1671482 RepID=UPI00191BA8F4|nr:anti-phage-associated DUF1156 domain-containing protein [Acidithrix sp. C25]CAG4907454.1 unnamed protein product [Acidithrix sp. C25]